MDDCVPKEDDATACEASLRSSLVLIRTRSRKGDSGFSFLLFVTRGVKNSSSVSDVNGEIVATKADLGGSVFVRLTVRYFL